MQVRLPLRLALRRGCALIGLCVACACMPLMAGTTSATTSGNPPERVARVSWLTGQASVLPAQGQQWTAIVVNRPIVRGDHVATDADARMELQLGDAVAHLAGDTELQFLALDQWRAQMALTQGTAELDVRTLPDGQEYEIDTPQVAVVVDRAARVRVDVGEGAATTVTVRRGTVVVHGDDGARQVLGAGQRYRFSSPALDDAVALTLGSGDAFEEWASSREEQYANADDGTDRYTARGTVGYRDLDRYGQWQDEADYGQVWFPANVAVDWVPYRNGNWTWIAPWGWTWISHEPWGFAPFHYGRWARVGGRWGWLPGPIRARAVYAPALVAFIGGSNWHVSFGISIGVRPVGWYPLGPGVIYNPWYAVRWNYYERVNRCDVRFRRHHRDWHRHLRSSYNAWRKPQRVKKLDVATHAPRGITVVSRNVLTRGTDVASARLRSAVLHDKRVRANLKVRALLHGPGITTHPVHAATWHPAKRAKALRKPVVALHRPTPVTRPVADVQTARQRVAWSKHRVRLLRRNVATTDVHRPLPARVVKRERSLPQPVKLAPQPNAPTARARTRRVKKLHMSAQPEPRSHDDSPQRANLPAVKRLHRLSVKPSRHVASGSPVAVAPQRPEVRRKPKPVLHRQPTSHPVPAKRQPRLVRHAQPSRPAVPVARRVPPRSAPIRSRATFHRAPTPARPRPRPTFHPAPVRHPRPQPVRRAPVPVSHPRPAPAPRSRPAPVYHSQPAPVPRSRPARVHRPVRVGALPLPHQGKRNDRRH